jgi:SWI/SNF-related matrix-associated actin-dependent regulator 1 of chromatin subfamily A
MIRREKKEVLSQLPPKIWQVIELPCDDQTLIFQELNAYDQYKKARLELDEARKAAALHANDAEYRKRIRELAQKVFVRFSELSAARHKTALYKLPSVISHLETAIQNGKVVCIAHHRDVIKAIADAIPGSVMLVGGMKDAVKNSAVDSLQNNANTRLFVGSIKAAGVGLTLTASHNVVFAESDWTPALLTQAEDRCHRIGQGESVLIQHLVLHGSLDAKMAKMCADKQDVIDQVMENK